VVLPTTAKKKRRTDVRPRGLAYLERLLTDPGVAKRLSAFARFRQYIEARSSRRSRMTALDRARGAELVKEDPHLVIDRWGRIELPASAWAVIYGIGNQTDSSPKSVLEALIYIGLEQTASSVRSSGSSPDVISTGSGFVAA
jgi:hypothetical protein